MKLDEIGDWSLDKLEILKRYAEKYSAVLASQDGREGKAKLKHGYIDGFAGAGQHIAKSTKGIVPGSPLNALSIKPEFDEYHFVELNPERVDNLKALANGRTNVHVHHGNCNQVLLKTVFPRFRYEDFRRGLCFLDPYGMQLNWEVIAKAGQMGTIEIFLNFPIMDINRNVKHPGAKQADKDRFTAFWGDTSWNQALTMETGQYDLFSGGIEKTKADNEWIVAEFRRRLKEVAGFKFVPEPVAMKIPEGAVVYYLFFAGNNGTGDKIARHVLNLYRH
jgi:three-Cys-motif partner protein